jgi:hypothetical protein
MSAFGRKQPLRNLQIQRSQCPVLGKADTQQHPLGLTTHYLEIAPSIEWRVSGIPQKQPLSQNRREKLVLAQSGLFVNQDLRACRPVIPVPIRYRLGDSHMAA